MWRGIRTVRTVLSLLAGLALCAPALAAPQVTGVRIGQHEETTRFVLDLSERLEYRVFTLDNPYRVVIDMPEVGWQLQSESASGRGLVNAFRFGLFSPETTRIVLDVAKPVKVERNFILEPKGSTKAYRVVIDLAAVSAEEFQKLMAKQGPPPAPAAQGREASRDPPVRKPTKPVIVIDAGHGGVDPGTIGVRGTYEKDVTLAVARALRKQLLATGKFEVRMTRERDMFVALRDRVDVARSVGASMFVSLHADSIKNKGVRGASIYTLSEKASDSEAAALAASENKADVIAGIDLTTESDDVATILIDLAQRETMNLSARFAALLIDELHRETLLLRNTHRFAGFVVLKAPDVPSVLVELGYLSNPRDEGQLRTPAHQAKIAGSIARAIERYFREADQLSRS